MNENIMPEYSKDTVINFENGIAGFEEYRKFIVFPFEEDNDAVFYLKSEDIDGPGFVIMNPFYLVPDYKPALTAEQIKELRLTEKSQVAYFVIAVVNENMDDSTVNMRCPVVVNVDEKIGRQVILDAENYGFRERLGDLTLEEEAK